MTEMLTVRDLSVRFNQHEAVKNVSFSLDPGECVALVGESGSGKSVTARSLLGLSGGEVTASQLEVNGEDLRDASERRWRRIRGAEVGLILQDALQSLDPLRPVGREIAEALTLHGRLSRPARRRRVREFLESAGLENAEQLALRRSSEMSGGQRQRALIASALAADPSILIADEPTTALDMSSQSHVLSLLHRLKENGLGLLLITHDLAVVRGIADRVLVMEDGVVCESGEASGVLRRPQSHAARMLLASSPTAAPRKSPLVTAPLTGPPAPPRPARLEGTRLTVTYARTRALSEVSGSVQGGSTTGVIGESGSGKSTFARALLALESVTTGSVSLDEKPWNPSHERRRRPFRGKIGHVEQDSLGSFDPRWTVGRILRDAAGISRRSPDQQQRIGQLLSSVRLSSGVVEAFPSQLSGGQRQRVAIARALAPDPDLLILDEPVSALDVTVQAHILDLFDRLQHDLGLGYLMISHDLDVIRHMSDSVIVLYQGEVVEHGPTEVVLSAPQHPYTRQLLADAPAGV